MRPDLYARPHKALRALMADTLVALGRVDRSQECEVRDAQARVEEMLVFCEHHLRLEDEYVHRAMEAKERESSCALAGQHLEHVEAIAALREAARENAPDLYRRVGAFVADNLVHMDYEEREGNSLLWRLFTDEELGALEARVGAAIPPEFRMVAMRWMLAALSHPERVAMLRSMSGAPPAVMQGVLAVARTHLSAREYERLELLRL